MKEKKLKPKKEKKVISESELPPSVIKKRKAKKRRIKFLISLIILFALFFFAFWMGWIQVNLQKDQIAVITNKIQKSKKLYNPDHFYWEAAALIPGNVRVEIYENSPHTIQLKRLGTLPSGHFYSRYLHPDETDHFDYAIDMEISYRIKEEKLIELATHNQIKPIAKSEKFDLVASSDLKAPSKKKEKKQKSKAQKKKSDMPESDLQEKTDNEEKNETPESPSKESTEKLLHPKNFWEQFEAQIQAALYSYLTKRSSENEFVTRLGLDNTEIEKELSLFIETINPNIEVIGLVVQEIRIPDYDLYQKIKEAVQKDFTPNLKISSSQKEILQEEVKRAQARNKIEVLTELGKLLTEYPLLVDYLKLYATSEKDLDLLQLNP